jgi:hypothetical protein
MATTGVINATGEELLWRGVFLEPLPHDLVCAVCSGRLPGSRFGISSTDDLAVVSRPLAARARRGFRRFTVDNDRVATRRPAKLPGFSYGD